MLALDSPRWRELTQAHGTAEDIPRLLAALVTMEEVQARTELWFGLWATLCPDGRLHDAAYAAVPHVLAITRVMGAAERGAAMHLAAEVESLRHGGMAPPIPHDLVPAYAMAIESLPSRVAEMAAVAWDAEMGQVMAAALLAGKRQPSLARAILALGMELSS